MVQEDNLSLARVRMPPHQYVARVGVTVHETVDKDHLAVHLAQVAGDLKERQSSGCPALPTPAAGTSFLSLSSHIQETAGTVGPEQFETMSFSHRRQRLSSNTTTR